MDILHGFVLQSENKENKVSNLTRFNLLIHPLYLKESFSDESSDRFNSDRKRFINNVVEKMMPASQTEATLISPYYINKFGVVDLRNRIALSNSFPYPQLPDLYKSLTRDNPYKRGVIMGSNLISNNVDKIVSPDAIELNLKRKGFVITGATEVVVGGEMLNACFQEGVLLLLRLPQVNALKIPKSCTLTISDFLGEDASKVEQKYDRFVRHMEDENFLVDTIEGNIIIKKKK